MKNRIVIILCIVLLMFLYVGGTATILLDYVNNGGEFSYAVKIGNFVFIALVGALLLVMSKNTESDKSRKKLGVAGKFLIVASIIGAIVAFFYEM